MLLPLRIETIYRTSSQFGDYSVVDMNYYGRSARVLFGNGGSPQSGMALDDSPEQLFDYHERFLEIVHSAQPQNILMIGGGAMVLPTAVLERSAESQIDVVEVDEALVEIAKNYFEFSDNPRLQVHVDDGMEFIKRSNKNYDMIIVDAFHGYKIPEHLVSAASVKLYKSVLTPGGAIVFNIISPYGPAETGLASRMIKAFSRQFRNVGLYRSDPADIGEHEQNYIFAASNSELHFEYLQTRDVLVK